MQPPNQQPWQPGQPPPGQPQPGQPRPGQSQTPLPPAYSDPLAPPNGYPPGAPVDSSVNGTIVLVMGILGLLACQIFGVVAWVMGNSALRTLDSGRGDESQRQLVVVGRILGIIATVLMIVVGLFMMGVVIIAVVAGLNTRPTTAPTVPLPSTP